MSARPATETSIAHEHLIIGGAIKGATSSLFGYLSTHPEVCGSSIKETFFFTHRYRGRAQTDLARYRRYFASGPQHKVLVEASPNYLGYEPDVAPRIKALLPEARLLFSLRDPIDRAYSQFNFAAAKLEIPQGVSFEDFLDRCERFMRGELQPAEARIAKKHLLALHLGEYAKHLKRFLTPFPPERVKIVFFENLKADPVAFMTDVCEFVGIDPAFYRDYAFGKVNVTFSARRRSLHAAAIIANWAFEPVLRQRPEIKTRLVGFYKRLNQGREGYVPMAEATRARLAAYYAAGNRELKQLLREQKLPAWLS